MIALFILAYLLVLCFIGYMVNKIPDGGEEGPQTGGFVFLAEIIILLFVPIAISFRTNYPLSWIPILILGCLALVLGDKINTWKTLIAKK